MAFWGPDRCMFSPRKGADVTREIPVEPRAQRPEENRNQGYDPWAKREGFRPWLLGSLGTTPADTQSILPKYQ